MNDDKFEAIKLLKFKYRMGDQVNHFLQNWFPVEIRSPCFNLDKFQDSEKSSPESCTMHWDLMNDDEFGSIKLLKFKYRSGGPNNSDFL